MRASAPLRAARLALALLLAAAAAAARAGDEAGAAGAARAPLDLEREGLAPTDHPEARYWRTPAAFDAPDFDAGPRRAPRKNYWVPALEVVGTNLSIWAFNYVSGKEFAQISWQSIQDNFHKGWIVDTDDFWANQFLHPYHGSLTFNAARSMGLSFYESFGYAFAGSLMWEQFMEVQPPSMNDQVNTPFGGAMLGEVLWRMHRLILDSGGARPGPWRELFAALVSPMAGLNRLAFGDTYRGPPVLPTSWIGEFRAGVMLSGSSTDNRTGARSSAFGPWGAFAVDLVYGVPGTPDLRLRAPFDHFDFHASLATTDTPQPTASLIIQGLLLGKVIGDGGDSGGLWGLYTSYDFVAPQVYRVAGFGLGPGVELMRRWGWFELHYGGLAELLPWAGAGSVDPLGARDYRYGVGAKLALHAVGMLGDRATVRLGAREYWVAGNYARGSSEDITYLTATATLRILGPHGVSANFDWSRRASVYHYAQSIDQKGSAWTLQYAFLQGW